MHGHCLQPTAVIRNVTPMLESRSHVYPAINVIWRYEPIIRMFLSIVEVQHVIVVEPASRACILTKDRSWLSILIHQRTSWSRCSRISPQTVVY